MEAILYGFQKAISLMNEKEIERKAGEEKDKKSILLCFFLFFFAANKQLKIAKSCHLLKSHNTLSYLS